MRGYPNNPVVCTKCGSPWGFPKLALCAKCKPAGRKKYFWTEIQEEDLRRIYARHVHSKRELGHELKAFAARIRFPKYIVTNRASQLRLSVDTRRRWTAEEIEFVGENAGQQPITFIMAKLGRGYSSVASMMALNHLRWKVTAGYSREDLSQVFGVSRRTVRMWISKRWLRPLPETDRVPENQVRRFVFNHPEEYSLKRVDEAWLKGLLFPKFGVADIRVHTPRPEPSTEVA